MSLVLLKDGLTVLDERSDAEAENEEFILQLHHSFNNALGDPEGRFTHEHGNEPRSGIEFWNKVLAFKEEGQLRVVVAQQHLE